MKQFPTYKLQNFLNFFSSVPTCSFSYRKKKKKLLTNLKTVFKEITITHLLFMHSPKVLILTKQFIVKSGQNTLCSTVSTTNMFKTKFCI